MKKQGTLKHSKKELALSVCQQKNESKSDECRSCCANKPVSCPYKYRYLKWKYARYHVDTRAYRYWKRLLDISEPLVFEQGEVLSWEVCGQKVKPKKRL